MFLLIMYWIKNYFLYISLLFEDNYDKLCDEILLIDTK